MTTITAVAFFFFIGKGAPVRSCTIDPENKVTSSIYVCEEGVLRSA